MVRTASRLARASTSVIGFDMGGTSTDVSHYAGEFERAFETQVAGVRMRAPMMSIHTVAAGGGSILALRRRALARRAARAPAPIPGPACYRRGGPLTVTDANVMLGKIQPAHFPRGVRPARRRSRSTATWSSRASPRWRPRSSAATGSARSRRGRWPRASSTSRSAHMANAIKKISVARGYDVTRYTLQCFGGAGGQHACRVADALGMTRVFVHPLAGVLSAYGMGLADQSVMREAAVELPLADALGAAPARASTRSPRDAAGELRAPGRRPRARSRVHRRVHLRYEGTDSALVVPFGERRRDARRVRGGLPAALRVPDARARALIVEAVSVEAVGAGRCAGRDRAIALQPAAAGAGRGDACSCSATGAGTTPRSSCASSARPGHVIDGPAIIAERNATTVVEPGWQARVTALDHLVLERVAPREARRAIGTTVDPVMLEVFNNLFMNIAEQMGLQLQNTAYSVNIKERLDFSCALFDADGNLIANAPHMPVHLGSMSESIKTVIARNAGAMRPGDVYVLNDPYHGGTHLPDVTVVTPVYLDDAATRGRPSTSARAATMPTSAASRRARCRRSRPASRKRAC